jgi:hypothetical protein
MGVQLLKFRIKIEFKHLGTEINSSNRLAEEIINQANSASRTYECLNSTIGKIRNQRYQKRIYKQ